MSDYKNVKTMSDAKAGDFRQVNYYFLRKAEDEIADLKAENKRLDDIISRRRINRKDFEDADTGNLQLQLTAERAESAKLAEVLKPLVSRATYSEEKMSIYINAKKALAEYKAKK